MIMKEPSRKKEKKVNDQQWYANIWILYRLPVQINIRKKFFWIRSTFGANKKTKGFVYEGVINISFRDHRDGFSNTQELSYNNKFMSEAK